MTDEDKNIRLRQELRQSLDSIDLSTVECNGSKLNNTNSQLSKADADIQRLHYLAHTAKSTASDWTIGLANFWLQSCINGHARCPKPSGHLPSRLLDLTEPSRARVIETHDLRGVEYLTLSHCWGGANMLLLESSTADSLFSGVGLSTMPKSFRDAVHVTTRLGYNYLWIDSLCIMQDSAEDWSRESGPCIKSICIQCAQLPHSQHLTARKAVLSSVILSSTAIATFLPLPSYPSGYKESTCSVCVSKAWGRT